MKKKVLLGLMALTASATVFAGCGKKEEKAPEVVIENDPVSKIYFGCFYRYYHRGS